MLIPGVLFVCADVNKLAEWSVTSPKFSKPVAINGFLKFFHLFCCFQVYIYCLNLIHGLFCGDRKFSIYPDGDKNKNSIGHVSVLLGIEDTAALPKGWEIYTDIKFFIFDQLSHKYSIFQGGGSLFNQHKKEWGITKLVSRVVFDDPAKGYLVNDKCIFGVEVFVLDSMFTKESLGLSVGAGKTFTWRISDYSDLGSEVCYSEEFFACSFKWLLILFWVFNFLVYCFFSCYARSEISFILFRLSTFFVRRLKLYPLGINYSGTGENVSLYLGLVDQNIYCAKLLVHFMLCIRNQKSGSDKKIQSMCSLHILCIPFSVIDFL